MGQLFYDDANASVRAAIEKGEGYKATAALLYPTMKWESAYAKLKSKCEGREHLTFEEVIAIGRFNKRADALFHHADELTHDRPLATVSVNKAAALIDEFNKNVVVLQRLGEEIQKLAPDLAKLGRS